MLNPIFYKTEHNSRTFRFLHQIDNKQTMTIYNDDKKIGEYMLKEAHTNTFTGKKGTEYKEIEKM